MTKDYYTFGAPMPGRQYSSSTGYPYGFNGKEKVDEISGSGNSYDFDARYNDVRLGKWWSVDPWASKYPWQSPYVSMDNNPISKTDPTGKGTESVHVDKSGKVLRNYNDGDNTVFVHENGTSAQDVDQKYVSEKGHAAGGTKIGELGKSIDVNTIFSNVLKTNKEKATDLNSAQWALKVKGDGEWDLKNNKETIFGVAWGFDLAQDAKDPDMANHKHTTFKYKDFYHRQFDAAALGNYHAGYMGSVIGIPTILQKVGAGFVENLKNKTMTQYMKNATYLTPPYFGDMKNDYYWNTKGMSDGEKTRYTNTMSESEIK